MSSSRPQGHSRRVSHTLGTVALLSRFALHRLREGYPVAASLDICDGDNPDALPSLLKSRISSPYAHEILEQVRPHCIFFRNPKPDSTLEIAKHNIWHRCSPWARQKRRVIAKPLFCTLNNYDDLLKVRSGDVGCHVEGTTTFLGDFS